LKRVFAVLLAVCLTVGPASSGMAIETVKVGQEVYWGTCFSKKLPGKFTLQVKKSGGSWTSVGSDYVWDDRQDYSTGCPKYAVGVDWTPKTAGTYSLRLRSSSTGKNFETGTLKVVSPTVAKVSMPRLVGMVDGDVSWWLKTKNFRFSLAQTKSKPGWNTTLSCLMGQKQLVVQQSPAAGTAVVNSSATNVQTWVNCG
jgi:hypothetical protein